MLSLARPKPIMKIKTKTKRRTPRASMNLLGLVCGSIAIYSTVQWYDARLKRRTAEGKPMWPWEE